MHIQTKAVLHRAKWAIISILFVVSQLGPLTLLANNAKAGPVVTPKITSSSHEGQLKTGGVPGAYISGDIKTYTELDTINFRFTIDANGVASGQMQLEYSEYDGKCTFFDGSFNLGTWDGSAPAVSSVSGATPTITKAGAPSASSGDWVQPLNISFTGAGTAVVNYYLKLTGDAGECTGSSSHTRLGEPAVHGDYQNTGAENVPIPANDIIELPDITVVKYIAKDDGSFRTAAAGEWSFSLDGKAPVATDANGKVVYSNVTPDGTHTITESASATYSLASVTGDNCVIGTTQNTATATVQSGTTASDATCNFYNRKVVQPTIKLVKIVENTYGGGPVAGVNDFGLRIGGTAVNSGDVYKAEVGKSYVIDETGLVGYEFKSLSGTDCPTALKGSTAVLKEGQNIVCTITNKTKPATLIVQKEVINDNGGTKKAADFSFTYNGGPASTSFIPKVDQLLGENTLTLGAGTYTLTENQANKDGYTTTVSGCEAVTVGFGETKTCKFTNNDNAPALTLIKKIINDNGGLASVTDWTLTATGANASPTNLSGKTGSADVVSGPTFKADTYTLGEKDGPNGYTTQGWACTGGVSVVANKITLVNGQSTECTVTNNDDAPGLTLVKKLGDTFGSTATIYDWTLTATGSVAEPTNLSGKTGSDGAKSGTDFKADTYSFGEANGPSGFEASDWSCVNNITKQTTTISSKLAIALGQSFTCTVTNTAIQPKLIVKKHVVNDNGGTKKAADFTMIVSGNTVTVPNFAGNETGTDVLLNEGSYAVDELGDSGYVKSFSGDCSGAIKVGETKTCTVTNDDKAPMLTLKKLVINDNGGSAKPADWTLEAIPQTNTVGALALKGNGENGVVKAPIVANLGYDLYENYNAPAGYSQIGWTCDGGTLKGSTITLDAGQDVTCTVKNDDIAPKLELNKIVKNDDGGKAVETDWTLQADGPTPISGAGSAKSDDLFKAGTYTLSETGSLNGYKASEWSCTNDVEVNANNQITLANNQSTVCTITNDDQKGTVIVKKTVDNDDGGTKTASDFSYTLGEKTYWFNEDSEDPEHGEVRINVPAGTYSIREDQENQGGYETDYRVDVVCDNEYGKVYDLLPINRFNENYDCAKDCDDLYVGNGQEVICEIHNDDIAPKISLFKDVINNNSGTYKSSDWTLTATPAEDNNVNAKTISGNGEDGVVNKKAKANVQYALSESGPAGYTAGKWSCEGGELEGNILTLKLEEDATCVITNDDIAHPSIKVVKSGPATAKTGDIVTYTFTVTNTGDTPLDEVIVSDNIAGKGVYQSGDTNNDKILQTTETWVYTAQYTIPNSAAGLNVNNTVKACGVETLPIDELSDNIRILQLNEGSVKTTVATVCDEDNHSLTVEKPAELVNTGSGSSIFIGGAIAALMFGGAFIALRPRPSVTATAKK